MSLDLDLLRVNPKAYVRVDLYAGELGLHPRTLKRWSAQGRFPKPVKYGKYLWVRRDDADTRLEHCLRHVKPAATVVARGRDEHGRYLGESHDSSNVVQASSPGTERKAS